MDCLNPFETYLKWKWSLRFGRADPFLNSYWLFSQPLEQLLFEFFLWNFLLNAAWWSIRGSIYTNIFNFLGWNCRSLCDILFEEAVNFTYKCIKNNLEIRRNYHQKKKKEVKLWHQFFSVCECYPMQSHLPLHTPPHMQFDLQVLSITHAKRTKCVLPVFHNIKSSKNIQFVEKWKG